MKKPAFKIGPHIIALLIFILIPVFYFPSMFQGKEISQSDMKGYLGMAKEITDFRDETGEEALWTNSMFSGMPAYLINMRTPFNIFGKINQVFSFQAGRPAIHIFLYMFGFYILLLLFGMNPWLGIIGGIAYGFSSYFFIILEPGHITKAIALGYLPMIIGSVYYSFRSNFVVGAILTSVFLGLQIVVNHLQITYYTLLIILIFGIFELVEVIKNNDLGKFTKIVGTLLIGVVLSISVNLVNFWSVSDYSEYSLRGPSELTSSSHDKTSGLDKSYATGWSYGLGETFNLLIPNFKGGASSILMADEDSETFKFLSKSSSKQQAMQIINQNAYFFTQYWGNQPGTSGPVYIGAVIVFLFVFGMFFMKGRIKWWLFTVVVFSILLSWGKNFMFLTDFFLDYFPGYNKFRTVSMILIMTEFAMPLLAILAINKLILGDFTKKEFQAAFKNSLIMVGGISLLFALFPAISDLSSEKDKLLIDQGASDLVNAIREDRSALLRADAFRSLIFVLIAAALLYSFFLKKVKLSYFYILLGLIILIDLWPVNKRYLNDENFVRKSVAKTPYQPNEADLEIMKDKELYYRVFDMTQGDPFASSRASYFHKSIGGYHGAKMRRYQEVFDHHIKEGIDEDVLNMLNTKYLIQRDQNSGKVLAVQRSGNLGNAWFVSNYELVRDADEEIQIIGQLNPSNTVSIDNRFENYVEGQKLISDPNSSIELVDYAPNKLVYDYSTTSHQIAVFSDIYYPKGWVASINGEEVPYFRVNYILRGIIVPPGSGSIVFEFKPNSYFIGSKISTAASVIVILLILGIALTEIGVLKLKFLNSEKD
ncbi:MAG: YfhO family protein [Bacteroidales bacterium]|nr:YfhO family protein [Bacteroidales bacterium]MCF8405472.1 YfhO family protein [Bacteroidales bacterium]